MCAAVFADVPVLCGHRGSGQGVVHGHPENTLGSFHAAGAAGLRWVEVDARTTADGVLVARHDAVVPDGRFVSDLRAAEADALGLMRVGALLDDLPPAIGVDIDLKSSLGDALRPRAQTTAGLLAELVAPHVGSRPLLVTSFDPAALMIVRERLPAVALGLLTWRRFPLRKAIPAAVHLGLQVVAPQVESLLPRDGPSPPGERPIADSVRVAHEAGLQVVVWCPVAVEREPLIAAGVDCLIVDDAVAGS